MSTLNDLHLDRSLIIWATRDYKNVLPGPGIVTVSCVTCRWDTIRTANNSIRLLVLSIIALP
jgi:hypothetical protein